MKMRQRMLTVRLTKRTNSPEGSRAGATQSEAKDSRAAEPVSYPPGFIKRVDLDKVMGLCYALLEGVSDAAVVYDTHSGGSPKRPAALSDDAQEEIPWPEDDEWDGE